MNKKTIRDIVPQLYLCGKLLPGEFSDSVFVWAKGPCGGKRILIQRNYPVLINGEKMAMHYDGIPAPTFEEILTELRNMGIHSSVFNWCDELRHWTMEVSGLDWMLTDISMASLALRFYLHVRNKASSVQMCAEPSATANDQGD